MSQPEGRYHSPEHAEKPHQADLEAGNIFKESHENFHDKNWHDYHSTDKESPMSKDYNEEDWAETEYHAADMRKYIGVRHMMPFVVILNALQGGLLACCVWLFLVWPEWFIIVYICTSFLMFIIVCILCFAPCEAKYAKILFIYSIVHMLMCAGWLTYVCCRKSPTTHSDIWTASWDYKTYPKWAYITATVVGQIFAILYVPILWSYYREMKYNEECEQWYQDNWEYDPEQTKYLMPDGYRKDYTGAIVPNGDYYAVDARSNPDSSTKSHKPPLPRRSNRRSSGGSGQAPFYVTTSPDSSPPQAGSSGQPARRRLSTGSPDSYEGVIRTPPQTDEYGYDGSQVSANAPSSHDGASSMGPQHQGQYVASNANFGKHNNKGGY